MKLLDSTFLVDHLRGAEAAATYLEEHDDETLVTTSINLKEIAVGLIAVDDAGFHEVRGALGWLDVVPFEPTHGYRAARIESELREDDAYEPRLAGDLLIAGAAADLGAPVVTRDGDDFERFAGVPVESY